MHKNLKYLLPYLQAISFAVIAVWLRLLLDPILSHSLIFIILYAAVALAAWLSGYKSAFLASIVGYILSNYLLIHPRGHFHTNPSDYLSFTAYAITCAIIIALAEKARSKINQCNIVEAKLRATIRRSETILESITDSFITLDKDWRFNYVNPAAEQLLQRSASELIGKNIWEEFPGCAGGEIESLYRKVTTTQSADSLTTYYARHDRWFEIRAFPSIEGIAVYYKDVTHQKQANDVLRASEQRRRLALDSAELGAWHLDMATGQFTADEKFLTIVTGSNTPITYEQSIQCIHQEDRARVEDAIAAAIDLTNPRSYAEEYRVVHPDGKIKWILAKGRPNINHPLEKESSVSFDGTVSDITARKRTEQLMNQQSAELAAANHRKNQFIATLAHELRNPLAPIRNALSIMELKMNDSQIIENARKVVDRQVTQMVRLIDDLLDISRISHGKLELKLQLEELRTILNNAIESSRPLLENACVELTVSIPGEPIYLNADSIRLSQVFINLLNNAAKFTDPGGQVNISAKTIVNQSNKKSVQIVVRDTGIGIAPESLPCIFEAFTQLPNSLKRSRGGLGVGLMLVKNLIEMHDGSITAHSNGLGMGSEFTVELPILVDQQLTLSNLVSIKSHGKNAKKLRILVVDDNQDAAMSLSTLLELMEYETHVAFDGESAINAIDNYEPNVVFLDIGLPDMSGYKVAIKIRQHKLGKSIKIFALTGWGQELDRDNSRLAGFDAHFVKPIDPAELSMILVNINT
jgi:PAS domain S-box-containing protein